MKPWARAAGLGAAAFALVGLGIAPGRAAPRLQPPEPPERPAELRAKPSAPEPVPPAQASPSPPILPAPSPPEAHAPAEPCLAAIARLGLVAEAAVTPLVSDPGCRIERPVRLSAMRVAAGLIAFPDRPLLDCRAAQAMGLWLRDLAIPLIKARLGADMTAMGTGQGFECRLRNRAASGKPSVHGKGLAIDIARIELGARAPLVIESPLDDTDREVIDALRRSACGWFTTTLGPGSDAAHASHLHFDIEARGMSGQGKFCQ